MYLQSSCLVLCPLEVAMGEVGSKGGDKGREYNN